jgi:hypothetical protein
MAVETFLVEELAELFENVEVTEEWKRKITECGLTGQATLIGAPDKSPIPFPALKEGEQRVYRALCPAYEPIEQYSADTIPMRVLALVALSRQQKWFGLMEVWHDYSKPDPILVGYRGENRWSSKGLHIIARWGDELRSYKELEKMAAARIKDQWKANLTTALATIDLDVAAYLNGSKSNLIISAS